MSSKNNLVALAAAAHSLSREKTQKEIAEILLVPQQVVSKLKFLHRVDQATKGRVGKMSKTALLRLIERARSDGKHRTHNTKLKIFKSLVHEHLKEKKIPRKKDSQRQITAARIRLAALASENFHLRGDYNELLEEKEKLQDKWQKALKEANQTKDVLRSALSGQKVEVRHMQPEPPARPASNDEKYLLGLVKSNLGGVRAQFAKEKFIVLNCMTKEYRETILERLAGI